MLIRIYQATLIIRNIRALMGQFFIKNASVNKNLLTQSPGSPPDFIRGGIKGNLTSSSYVSRIPEIVNTKNRKLRQVIRHKQCILLYRDYNIRYLAIDADTDILTEYPSIRMLYQDSKVKRSPFENIAYIETLQIFIVERIGFGIILKAKSGSVSETIQI